MADYRMRKAGLAGEEFILTGEDLVQICHEAAGAASVPMLKDNPDYEFPSGAVSEAVYDLLAHEQTQEWLKKRVVLF